MSMLSQRLDLRVQQKQTLTPGLVQMVTVLQLNRLELKEMISREVQQNPVLDEGTDAGEELTPAEVQAALEAERAPNPSDESFLEMSRSTAATAQSAPAGPEAEPRASDPFDEIDFGHYFEEYLDPGHKAPAQENSEKPSFETFLSSPVTLSNHLQSQLSLVLMSDEVRDAAETIIGNLDDNGYLTETLEDIAAQGSHRLENVEQALHVVHSLDPAGVGARNLQECLLIQIASNGGEGGLAWQIVSNHLKLLETRQYKELARVLNRPAHHVEIAVHVIQALDPKPGLRYSGPGARQIEPDVYFVKDGDRYLIQLNDDDIPQLRLNGQYRRMLDRDKEPSKDVRDYVKERFNSALLLIKNIEQRRRTILQVCEKVIEHQLDFLDNGIENLRPMMIKDIAGEIGVHPSTVSRAVANKYAHTPQGVLELRTFFSEAVQGPAGSELPLVVLKRKVKKMIEEEDSRRPLTDDQITALLKGEGIFVTRRTVAKYREDLKIPSTHQRRRRE